MNVQTCVDDLTTSDYRMK